MIDTVYQKTFQISGRELKRMFREKQDFESTRKMESGQPDHAYEDRLMTPIETAARALAVAAFGEPAEGSRFEAFFKHMRPVYEREAKTVIDALRACDDDMVRAGRAASRKHGAGAMREIFTAMLSARADAR